MSQPGWAVLVAMTAVAVSCRSTHDVKTAPPASSPPPPIVQPGAPGQPSKVISAAQSTDLSQVEYTGADIKFMQGMIGHHAQALEMVELLKTHSSSDDMKKLGLRIALSQDDEIRMMQGWLQVRGQRVPARTELHQHGAQLMPGMLTPDEMKQLEEATGAAFDKLFLEGMIKHHGGALSMVRDLLDTPGAAQASDIFSFVSDVEADQRAEIDRMGAMLATMKEFSGSMLHCAWSTDRSGLRMRALTALRHESGSGCRAALRWHPPPLAGSSVSCLSP